MQAILWILVGLGILFLLAFCCCFYYIWAEAGWWARMRSDYDYITFTSVSAHTYRPTRRNKIPRRGRIVLEESVRLAIANKCPLILTGGCSGGDGTKTEAEIYSEEIGHLLPDLLPGIPGHVNVLIGKNRSVRETYEEAREAIINVKMIGSDKHLVVGLDSHMARIQLVWKKIHPEDYSPEISFYPVKGTLYHWLRETLALMLHLLAPPRSRRQDFILDMLGRRSQQKI